MAKSGNGHDIIVIGASAGGLEALKSIFANIPADIPAAIFIVMHLGAQSHLARILERVTALPVVPAQTGQQIRHGCVYVAVPDRHLLLHNGHVLLRRGPRENMSRPAIDPLFRSAAASFGGRVIGVVLSGSLSDGTSGLQAIKRCGGLTVVQDPLDALVPGMPRSALRHVDVDHCVPVSEMAVLLDRLAGQEAGATPEKIPFDIRLEAAIASEEVKGMAIEDQLGTPSRFTCPECHGALWELADSDLLRYRCHLGHAFTGDAMLSAQSSEIDTLLETLLRSHREHAALANRMAQKQRNHDREDLARHLEARARGYEEDAEVIDNLIRERNDGPVGETPN